MLEATGATWLKCCGGQATLLLRLAVLLMLLTLCVPTMAEPAITRSRAVSYTVQRTDNLLVGAGTSPSASLMGQMQTLNAMDCGEVRNSVWLGFPFSAGAVAHAMAVCGAEVLQPGVSCVLQSSSSFSTVDETVLAAVEIPPFERIKMKAMVWCKGLGISHSL